MQYSPLPTTHEGPQAGRVLLHLGRLQHNPIRITAGSGEEGREGEEGQTTKARGAGEKETRMRVKWSLGCGKRRTRGGGEEVGGGGGLLGL